MEFLEQIGIVAITALIGGVVIPVIFGRIDRSRIERQKAFEAELARQSKLIEAQSKFLDELSQQLWSYRYLAMAVSYYKPDLHPDRYEKAVSAYDEQSWDLFNQVRTSISKARRLISESSYLELVDFYHKSLVPCDRDRVQLVINSSTGHSKLNQFLYTEFTQKIDDVLFELSKQLKFDSLQRVA